jgi:hypothetical protein
MNARRLPWLIATSVSLLASLVTWDWIPGVAALLLFAAWRRLRDERAPPVLALAFTFQWLQVVAAPLYFHLTGRRVRELDTCDYQPMVALGLGALLALLVGLAAGTRRRRGPSQAQPEEARPFRFATLFGGYLAVTLVSGTLVAVAWELPLLTQAILAFGFLRLALLFLMLRRLVRPRLRWVPLLALLLVEVVLGFSGYFASFREALMMAALAVLEAFSWRRAGHWIALAVVAGLLLVTGVVWTGIKGTYRRQFRDEAFAESASARLESVQELSLQWLEHEPERMVLDADKMVSRLWAIYYPALALKRVPAVLPHEHGAILLRALEHIVTPRVLFPGKAELKSDSEMVRKYSGLWVASSKQGTSIAFGYAGEAYIDFGVPWMFLPVLVYGFVMGLAYRWLMGFIRNREIAVALVCTLFWVSLALFERSWIKMLGAAGTLFIVLGGSAWLLDRLLARRPAAQAAQPVRAARRWAARPRW